MLLVLNDGDSITGTDIVVVDLPEFHSNDPVCVCVSGPTADLLTAEVARLPKRDV